MLTARLSGDRSMGKYLHLDSPKIEEIIDGIIDELVVSLRPRSVTVLGSFGRNEVSFIEDGEKLKFLSDCEISTVCNRYISRGTLNRLSSEISQRTGLEIVLTNSIILLLYCWFRVPSWISRRMWRPSIVNYERMEGAKVVYGENILERIPRIESGHIPLWEGIRLIFNRMAEALRYFPADGQARDESIFWINKVIFACQDTLLLLTKQYHYSYRTRSLRFQQIFPGQFSELNKRLPKFLSLASRATDYKLRAGKDGYPEDLSDLWFDTTEICDTIFRYIVKRDLDIAFDSYLAFQREYLRHPKVKGDYYLGIISSPIFHNITAAIKMITNSSYIFPPPQLVVKLRIPWRHIIYSVLPLVYFGLSRQGEISGSHLQQARDTISLFKRLKPKKESPAEEWKYIKEQTVDLWHILCC